MQVPKEEILKDIKTHKAITALGNQEGGEILISTLKKEVKRDIDIITSLYNDDEIKLRTAVISLRKDLSLLKLLTGSKKLLDIALEALEKVEDE